MVFYPSDFIPEYRPARKYSLLSSNGWWINRWPLLGWLETFLKVAAWCFVPYVAIEGVPMLPFESIRPSFVVETAVMILASALLTSAIIDRIVYREVISMVFVFPNCWAHWKTTAAMLRAGRDGINVRYLRIFCWLMLAGDIVKLVFFAVHDFSRLNIARYVLYALVATFAVFYSTILLIDYGYLSLGVMGVYTNLPLAALYKLRRA